MSTDLPGFADPSGLPAVPEDTDLSDGVQLSNTADVPDLSIGVLAERVRERRISPVDVLDACLARIDEINPTVNAFITLVPELARQQAEAAAAEIEAGNWRGPLHGVPVAVKDFYDTAGIRTTAGFAPFRNRVPAADATVVRLLKTAGAVLVGKTNMHELGMGTTSLVSDAGPVRNPRNPDHIAGGSSGGSAAAVAAGMCYATVDTDAIGSCRLPAAACGVVGFKGTYGLIDNTGILSGEETDAAILWLAHAAITTRTVADVRLLLAALSERVRPPLDRTGAKPRLGVVTNVTVDAEIAAGFDAAVEAFRELGYPVVNTTAPLETPGFDIRQIEADREGVVDRFGDVDVYLLPTTAAAVPTTAAAAADPQALSPAHTLFANYYGLPAVSVPCGVASESSDSRAGLNSRTGLDRHGLPVGLQLVGKPDDDDLVLSVAREYEVHVNGQATTSR